MGSVYIVNMLQIHLGNYEKHSEIWRIPPPYLCIAMSQAQLIDIVNVWYVIIAVISFITIGIIQIHASYTVYA